MMMIIITITSTTIILITVLTNRLNNHLLRNNILPDEQKGCCRMYRGCKDQLLVSKLITSFSQETSKVSMYGMD